MSQLYELRSARTPLDTEATPRKAMLLHLRGSIPAAHSGSARIRQRGTLETMYLDSAHVATSIDRCADEVCAFVSDPRNLPAWAAGLAQSGVQLIDGGWIVESPLGRVKVAFVPPNAFGVADHDVTLPSGEVVVNPLRIVPNADGCDVIFTVRRRDGKSAAEFAADIDTVTADLATLRRLMEQR